MTLEHEHETLTLPKGGKLLKRDQARQWCRKACKTIGDLDPKKSTEKPIEDTHGSERFVVDFEVVLPLGITRGSEKARSFLEKIEMMCLSAFDKAGAK